MTKRAEAKRAQQAAEQFRRLLGARLRERRVMAGLSIGEVARGIAVSESQLCRYEAGDTGVELSTIVAIAAAVKCSVLGGILIHVLPELEDTKPPISNDGLALARAFDALGSDELRKLGTAYVRDLKRAADLGGSAAGKA